MDVFYKLYLILFLNLLFPLFCVSGCQELYCKWMGLKNFTATNCLQESLKILLAFLKVLRLQFFIYYWKWRNEHEWMNYFQKSP